MKFVTYSTWIIAGRSTRFVGKPEGVNNVFFTYFYYFFRGSIQTWGVEKQQRGVKTPWQIEHWQAVKICAYKNIWCKTNAQNLYVLFIHAMLNKVEQLFHLSTTIALTKHRTAGKTWIFSLETRNFAFSTLIFPNFDSKCFSDKVWNKRRDSKLSCSFSCNQLVVSTQQFLH